MQEHALFTRQGSVYTPTDHAGSPWQPGLLHGGSPAGLLCHLLNELTPAGMRPSRVTMDLLRPVPKAPLEARAYALREGNRLQVHVVELHAGGKLIARATGGFVRPQPVSLPDYTPASRRLLPLPEFLPLSPFGEGFEDKIAHIPYGLHNVMQVKALSPLLEQGSGRAWMRVPMPVVDGMLLTPMARVGVVSDFANAVGQLNLGNDAGMINADITLMLHRLPAGEWIGLDGEVRATPDGVGVVRATVFDEQGEIGIITQSVIPQQEYRG